MKVLLTGAFGNVGMSALTELVKQGHSVRCFDLKTKANQKAAQKFKDQIEVTWGDLRRPEDVAAAVRDRNVVVHLAFIIPKMSATGIESEAQPDLARAVNVGGTRNLIEAMQAQPIPPRLVFTSSLHVYGRTPNVPPPRTVSDPVQATEHYSQHKIECEQMVRESGLEYVILRLAATLPLSLKLDGSMFDVPVNNRIEFAHTRDVGLAIANAVSSEEVWGKTLLIGGGESCQFYYGDMVRRILDALGVGMLPKEAFGQTPFPTDWLDTTESQRLLHYQQRDLDDYIQNLSARLGYRRHLVRMFLPAIRHSLLRQSPYYRRSKQRAITLARPGRQVALVTGASSGIGAATATRLAQGGFAVALVARRVERLERLADQIRQDGGEALVLPADLTDEKERRRVYDAVHAAYGPVDVLVNNAGLGWYGYGAEMSWKLAWQMIQTNLVAVTHLTLLFLRDMKVRDSGHIINIGSVVGSLPSQGVALYGATKSFVDSFTTALYRELKGTNVHVSVVRPGAVATEFYDVAANRTTGLRIPVEKFSVRPEAVAGRVWSLLRRPRRVAYVPWSLWFVPWVEPALGWLIDLLGPMLLRHQAKTARQIARP